MPYLKVLDERPYHVYNRTRFRITVDIESEYFTTLAPRSQTTISTLQNRVESICLNVTLSEKLSKGSCKIPITVRQKPLTPLVIPSEDRRTVPIKGWLDCRRQGIIEIVLIDAPPPQDWMSYLPSELLLSSLILSGTHESTARYGFPLSNCQSQSHKIKFQLESGIRFLDLRFSVKNGILKTYHGIQNEFDTAEKVFEEIYNFLGRHPSEMVVASIKQEDGTAGFQEKVFKLIDIHRQFWYLRPSLGTLGQARGKILLFSRFGSGYGLGFHPPIWPNNSPEPFSYIFDNTQVITQDWYDIGSILSIPDKFSKVVRAIRNSLAIPSYRPTLYINFTTAGSLLAFPFIVAKGIGIPTLFGLKGVNERLLELLLDIKKDDYPFQTGHWILLDFFNYPFDQLVPLINSFNFDRLSLVNSNEKE